MPLGAFFGPPFERNTTSIFSFELRNWIKNGPDTVRGVRPDKDLVGELTLGISENIILNLLPEGLIV